MIATFNHYGRLGNHLFTFANLAAFSETHHVPLFVASFSAYRREFPFFDSDPWCRYPSSSAPPAVRSRPAALRLAAAMGIVPTVRFWQPGSFYFDEEGAGDPRLRVMIRSSRVVFEGWDFRSRRAILQFRERIISVFRPRPAVQEEVRRRAGEVRRAADVVVGVHVRWADYRGTDRFIDLAGYDAAMRDVRALLAPRTSAFVVVSPEEVPLESLPANSFKFPGHDPVADMYSLAECDYIMGPPSTFSMWASYYGGKPLFIMAAGRRFESLSQSRMATP